MKKIILGIITFIIGISVVDAYTGNFVFKLNKNGGTGGTSKIYLKNNDQIGSKAYSDSARTSNINKINIPVRKGYAFEGYYASDYKKKLISRKGTIKEFIINNYISSKNKVSTIKLTGKWKKLKYIVNLRSNGVTLTNPGTTTLRFAAIDEGAAYNLESKQVDKINIPKRNGYAFAGYYITYNGREIPVINSKGNILSSSYTKEISNNYKSLNLNGYKYKTILNGFIGNNLNKITVYAKWNRDGSEIPIESISVVPYNFTLAANTNKLLEISYLPSEATNTELSFSSDNEKVAAVDASGIVTGLNPGKAKITISAPNGVVEAYAYVTVTEDGTELMTNDIITLAVGGKESFPSTIEPTEDIIYTSANSSIASVSDDGIITGKKAGSTIVTLKNNNNSINLTTTVKVVNQNNLVPAKITPTVICYAKKNWVKPGKTKKFTYKVLNNIDNEKVKISIVNEEKANKIFSYNSKTKKFTGKKIGSGYLKVSVGSFKQKCKISIAKSSKDLKTEFKVDSLTNELRENVAKVDSSSLNIKDESKKVTKVTITGKKKVVKGNKITLKAKVKPSSIKNYKVTWSIIKNKNAVKLSKKKTTGSVTVKGLKTGKTAIIKAKIGKKTAKYKVKVVKKSSNELIDLEKEKNERTSSKLKITCNPNMVIKGKTINLKVTGGKKKYIWSSSNKKIATVTSTGKVKGIKVGKATITVKDSKKSKAICQIKVVNKVDKNGSEVITLEKEKGNKNTNENESEVIDFGFKKRIYVGDSRTVGMNSAVKNNSKDIFKAKVSMGYDWMTRYAIPSVESEIKKNTAVIILMGVNDPGNSKKYVSYVNSKAKTWVKKGASVYFVSINPVDNAKAKKHGYSRTNSQIISANKTIKSGLSNNVNYINTYSYLENNGFSTSDGIHYTTSTYKKIYNYINNNLK